jgi:hypothetical protein
MHALWLALVAGCTPDESGTAFPAADLVLFRGENFAPGMRDAQAGDEVVEGATDDGYAWSLASAGGSLYVGMPDVGEVRRYPESAFAGGAVVAQGPAAEAFAAAIDISGAGLIVGSPDHDDGPALGGSGAIDRVGDSVVRVAGLTSEARFGTTVALCGDLDADGVDEWAAAAAWESDLAGVVYVGSLADAGDLAATTHIQGTGTSSLGDALECRRDLLGDERADLVIGAPFAERDGISGAGAVFVYGAESLALGGTELSVRLDESMAGVTDGTLAITIAVDLAGEEPEYFGRSVAVCDFDGDARLDLAVGAPGAEGGRGAIYVFSGRTLRGLDLTRPQVVPSHRFVGLADSGRLGAAIACADLNGDGVDDLLGGAPNEDGETREIGALYAWVGPSSLWPDSPTPDDALATWRSDRAFLRAGDRFLADDLDGDGLAEVVMVLRQRARE